MDHYINKQAAQITEVTNRQLLSWSEKDLILATNKDDVWSGRRRLYDFTNLIEARLAKVLFEAGLGIRAVKNILDRTRGSLTSPDKDGLLLIQLTELCFVSIEITKIIKFIENRMPNQAPEADH